MLKSYLKNLVNVYNSDEVVAEEAPVLDPVRDRKEHLKNAIAGR